MIPQLRRVSQLSEPTGTLRRVFDMKNAIPNGSRVLHRPKGGGLDGSSFSDAAPDARRMQRRAETATRSHVWTASSTGPSEEGRSCSRRSHCFRCNSVQLSGETSWPFASHDPVPPTPRSRRKTTTHEGQFVALMQLSAHLRPRAGERGNRTRRCRAGSRRGKPTSATASSSSSADSFDERRARAQMRVGDGPLPCRSGPYVSNLLGVSRQPAHPAWRRGSVGATRSRRPRSGTSAAGGRNNVFGNDPLRVAFRGDWAPAGSFYAALCSV